MRAEVRTSARASIYRVGQAAGVVVAQRFCIRGEIMIILRFERRVCGWESCRMHQFYPRRCSYPIPPVKTEKLPLDIRDAT